MNFEAVLKRSINHLLLRIIQEIVTSLRCQYPPDGSKTKALVFLFQQGLIKNLLQLRSDIEFIYISMGSCRVNTIRQ